MKVNFEISIEELKTILFEKYVVPTLPLFHSYDEAFKKTYIRLSSDEKTFTILYDENRT